jgi:hypothetical protein
MNCSPLGYVGGQTRNFGFWFLVVCCCFFGPVVVGKKKGGKGQAMRREKGREYPIVQLLYGSYFHYAPSTVVVLTDTDTVAYMYVQYNSLLRVFRFLKNGKQQKYKNM